MANTAGNKPSSPRSHSFTGMKHVKDGFVEFVKAKYTSEKADIQAKCDAEVKVLQDKCAEKLRKLCAMERLEIADVAQDFERDPNAAIMQHLDLTKWNMAQWPIPQQLGKRLSLQQAQQKISGQPGQLYGTLPLMEGVQLLRPSMPQRSASTAPPKHEQLEEPKKRRGEDNDGTSLEQHDRDPRRRRTISSFPSPEALPVRSRGRAVDVMAKVKNTAQRWPTTTMTELQREFLSRQLVQLQEKDCTVWFREPVDLVEDECLDYFEFVTVPMDLGTIGDRLQSGYYESLQAFMDDFDLIINNTVVYNGKDHEVTWAACEMEREWLYLMLCLPTSSTRGTQP